MKNIFKSLMLVAVAAMTFTACQTDFEETSVADKSFTVTGIASFDDATRSGFGDYTAAAGDKDAFFSSKWDGGESVKVYLSETGYWSIWATKVSKMTVPSGGDGKTASFAAEFDFEGEYGDIPEHGTFTAYVPAEAWDGDVAVVPTFQTPREKSVDPAAHILIGTGKFENAKLEDVEFKFAHAVAYGKMTLKGVDTAFAPVKAELEFYGKDGKLNVVTLDTKNVKANEYWFAVNPMEVANFNVVVYDKDGNAYSKAATVGSSSSLNFVKGQVSTFNVTMEKGDLPYVKYADNSYKVLGGKNGLGDKPAFPLFIYNEGSSEDNYKLFLVCDEALYNVIPEGTYNYSKTATSGQYIHAESCEKVSDASVVVKHVVEKDKDGNVTFGGYKLNITIKDAEGNYAKYRFMDAIEADYDNWASGLNNPPIPFNEATIEGKVAEPYNEWDEPASVRGYYEATEGENAHGDRFELSFRVRNNDTKDEKDYEIGLTLETTAATKGLIPEGTYELGGKENFITEGGYADRYATGPQIALTKGSVKVEYTTDKKYKMTVNVTNEMKTTFKFVFEGTFKVNENSDFRNPADLPRLDTPEVKAEVVNNTSIKLTWDAVADATKYTVVGSYWDNELNKEAELTMQTTNLTEVVYEDLKPFTSINFYVTAKGDETKVKDSREASASATTFIDPKNDSAWVAETVEFTNGNCISADGGQWYGITLTNSDGTSFYMEFNGVNTENDLPKAGWYKSGYPVGDPEYDKGIDIDANLIFLNGSQIYPTLSAYVAVENGEYTLSIYGSIWDTDAYQNINTKFVYTGTLLDEDAEVEISGDFDYTFTSVTTELQDNGNWLSATFTDGTNTLTTRFGVGTNTNVVGTWSTDNWFSSGYAMDNTYINETYISGVSALVSESANGHSIQFSWTTYVDGDPVVVRALYDGEIF